jgi:hypothetical protein
MDILNKEEQTHFSYAMLLIILVLALLFCPSLAYADSGKIKGGNYPISTKDHTQVQ